MSIHGGVQRQLDLCSLRWRKVIDEQGSSNRLLPGWHLAVTVPFFDINISDSGRGTLLQRLTQKPYMYADRRGADLMYFGLHFDLSVDNGNDAELTQYGDCTVLDNDRR